jgi:hypothetical protein
MMRITGIAAILVLLLAAPAVGQTLEDRVGALESLVASLQAQLKAVATDPRLAALAPDPAEFYAHYAPPAGSEEPDAGTSFGFHDQGLFIAGHLIVERAGGGVDALDRLLFQVRDDRRTGPGGLGYLAGGGRPQLVARGGLSLIESGMGGGDTVDIRLGQIFRDRDGNIVDCPPGGSSVGRIYGESMGLHPVTGAPIWDGRSTDMIFRDLCDGGEIQIRIAPEGSKTPENAIRMNAPYPWESNHTPLMLGFAGEERYRHVNLWPAPAALGLPTSAKLLIVE